MPDLYIGKAFNPKDRSVGEPFRLKSSDLTTHGIVIGMTGSGKTGLSVCLIEELLKARVPVIVIDPKGDMGNLALAFDRLAPDQFEPWVDKDDAARQGKGVAQAASEAAAMWTKGLGEWGISTPDVAAYAAARRVKVFTPGATAGIPLNLIDSLAAPEVDFAENEEELRDEIDSIVTALLGFISVEADPVSSREYILLFTLIESAWRKGQDLDLESLIGQVANPPVQKVGALPLDAFYPQKDRNALMFALNNLVASPPFEVWRKGDPIDIESWVRSEDGLPQLSIVYTAHLDDEQRVFITALVLNKLKSWMRKQPGTSELRCLFYMDEIFGYIPPTANPPTKKPLLTLLKQARAYGVGILLSTQNPVDLDYKGLGNMGFWAIGRLQTEQDQARVRQGIESALEDAASDLDFETLIGGVQKRVFLIHDIHRKKPELVHSRWAMSYLRGPITRDEIRALGAGVAQAAGPQLASRPKRTSRVMSPAPDVEATAPVRPRRGFGGAVASAAQAARAMARNDDELDEPAPTAGPGQVPPLPAPFRPRFFRVYGRRAAEPFLYVKAGVRYRAGGVVSEEATRELAFPLTAETPAAEALEAAPMELHWDDGDADAPAGVRFSDPPAFLITDGAKAVDRVVRDRLDDRLATELLYDPITRKFAAPGESAGAFAARLGGSTGSSAKRELLEAKIAKKRNDLAIKQRELSGRKVEKWTSVGTSILNNIGVLTGKTKRVKTGGLGGILSKNRMESTSSGRVDALKDEIATLEQQLAEMGAPDPSRFELQTVKPTRTDVSIIRIDIAWVY
jgi:hypothetical protein